MRINKTFAAVALAILPLIVSACMKNYGHLSVESRVGQDFQAGVIQPDLKYYFSGRENMPYAIIGIDRAYTVASKYWINFTPDADKLRKMSANIYGKQQVNPYGALITAPDGKIVGVWYSNLYNYSVAVDPQSRTVQILFVNPENRDQSGM